VRHSAVEDARHCRDASGLSAIERLLPLVARQVGCLILGAQRRAGMTQCRRVRSHTWPACPLPLRQFRALIRRLWAPHVAGRDRAVVALDCEILGIESAAGDHPPPRAVGDRRL